MRTGSGQRRRHASCIGANLTEAIGHKQAESKLRHLSTHDPLTDIHNRSILERRQEEEVDRAKRYGHPLCVLFLDLDHFKRVNDMRGQPTGDRVLRALALLLIDKLRRTDICARYGVEEFAIILPETTAETSLDLAERLRMAIIDLKPTADDGTRLALIASIGLTAFPADADTPGELLKMSDRAMYQAKRQGRNRVCVYA